MDRIRLNASAKNQLATLKRRTGIEHNNALCRHALCISLANPSVPPLESYSFGVLEQLPRRRARQHVHRGLSYLVSRREDDLLVELAKSLEAIAS